MKVKEYQVFEKEKNITIETFIQCRYLDSTTMNGIVFDNGLKVEQWSEYQWVTENDVPSKTEMIYRFEFVPEDYDKINNLFNAIKAAGKAIVAAEKTIAKKSNLTNILDNWKEIEAVK